LEQDDIMKRIIQYIRDTYAEMKHVSWPTQKQTIIFTVLVILISIGVAFFIGFFDYIFGQGLDKIFLSR